MERRDALRLLATMAALPLLSKDVFALLREARSQLGATPGLRRTLNLHQDATVGAIAERIIPETDTPGATAAHVNEFIDLIVTEWYDDEERACFLYGLHEVDARSRALLGKNFVDCTAADQDDILRVLDLELAKELEPLSPSARASRATPKPVKNFFYMMKQLTLVGYYTSEIAAQKVLHYQIIPSRYDGCTRVNDGSRTSGR